MKKMLNPVFLTDYFYAVRANEFPHYWLTTYTVGRNKKIIEDSVCVENADQFVLSMEGRKAAEAFAKKNNGTVVFVSIETKKRFYYPPKLNKNK